MEFNISRFLESVLSGFKYLPNTIILIIIPIFCGLFIGTIFAIIRIYNIRIIAKLIKAFVSIYQGIPIVIALMIYNILYMTKFNHVAEFLNLGITIADTNPIIVGIFALSVAAICGFSESIRGALLAINNGQYEAGYSVGMTNRQVLIRIVIPQAIPISIGMLTNNIVGVIKGSSVTMTIGVIEIMSGAIIPASRTYNFFEGYMAAAMIYWILTMIIENLLKKLEEKSNRYGGLSIDRN